MKPEIEKILKREDGSRVKIAVNFAPTHHYGEYEYHVAVTTCPPKKRKFVDTWQEDWEYRSMSLEQRQEHRLSSCWDHVTVDEVEAVKLALWEKMRPETGR